MTRTQAEDVLRRAHPEEPPGAPSPGEVEEAYRVLEAKEPEQQEMFG